MPIVAEISTGCEGNWPQEEIRAWHGVHRQLMVSICGGTEFLASLDKTSMLYDMTFQF